MRRPLTLAPHAASKSAARRGEARHVARVVAGDDGEHARRAAHVARERADLIEARRERDEAEARDAPVRRLHARPTPVNAAGCRIEPPVSLPSAAGVMPDGHGDGAAARRAARRARRVARVLHRAERGALVRRAHRELVHVRLAGQAAHRPRAASRRPWRRTAAPSARGSSSRRWSRTPRVQSASFSAIGTPASGPSASPRARFASIGARLLEHLVARDGEERVELARRARRCARAPARRRRAPSSRRAARARRWRSRARALIADSASLHEARNGEAPVLDARRAGERVLVGEAGLHRRPRASRPRSARARCRRRARSAGRRSCRSRRARRRTRRCARSRPRGDAPRPR